MLSVVIVSYDSSRCIGGCIASVREHLPGSEVIVVDNASTDETVDLVRSVSGVMTIAMRENVGFGRACNVGADRATRRDVMFLNPDARVVYVDHDALRARLDRSAPLGLLVPLLDATDGEGPPHPALFPEWAWLSEAVRGALRPLRPRELRHRISHGRARADAWASGAMLIVRRQEFRNLGGFDATFFLYAEDRDLSRRYRDAGLPLRVAPEIRGRHAQGTSSGQDPRESGMAQAWALLGWLQYVHLHEGATAARRAWRISRNGRLAVRASVGLVASVTRLERWRRKADELLAADRALRQLVTCMPDGGYCPDAVELVRGSGASSDARSGL